ncbi:hypothetical protein ACFFX0_27100 [Citricoccus parietis]|uniref:Uncharacterized protein n=1 Tax=Citricoccus parietis TaxID=592307 RepID=A0ABV5G6T5_9MICC
MRRARDPGTAIVGGPSAEAEQSARHPRRRRSRHEHDAECSGLGGTSTSCRTTFASWRCHEEIAECSREVFRSLFGHVMRGVDADRQTVH